MANHTSLLPDGTHDVDHLLNLGVVVREVWAPEHGFRGTADAGEHLSDSKDPKTGLPVRSLYGKTKQPSQQWLEGLDFVLFDIQDVGVRFYTYSTTLSYVIDACVKAGVPLIVFDRGNPNGHYIDGPILQPGYESMVGLHPIPVVHGLTMGEYAKAVYGERWMPNLKDPQLRNAFEKAGGLTVIPAQGYSHDRIFNHFQVPPSPNLRNMQAIWLYPSLCFFEGTTVSCGRGTARPFTQFGAPWLPENAFSHTFTPHPDHGSKNPKFQDQICRGKDLSQYPTPLFEIQWSWFLDTYEYSQGQSTESAPFINSFLSKLVGSNLLQLHLENGGDISAWKSLYESELQQYRTNIWSRYKMY